MFDLLLPRGTGIALHVDHATGRARTGFESGVTNDDTTQLLDGEFSPRSRELVAALRINKSLTIK